MTIICFILSSHGTAVSGIIGAVKGNNICTVGVAYNASLVGKIPIINLAKESLKIPKGVIIIRKAKKDKQCQKKKG